MTIPFTGHTSPERHRTVGAHRAWCECGEWCYPITACRCCRDEQRRKGHAYTVPDGPKMLRETLCFAQGWLNRYCSDTDRRQEHSNRLQRLIAECDRKRPLGRDGKHGDLHTPECGCVEYDEEPLGGLPVEERDRLVAEVWSFLVQRGYTITAPGAK